MASELLTYTLEGNVAVVRMDDGKANALSDAMIDAILEALARAENEAGAMILAGREGRFSGGFDLKVMMSSPAAAKALLTHGVDLFMKLYASKVPLVIACTGHALAGGALMVLCGDLRVGAEGAFRIGLNEVEIGLPVPVLAMELARDRLAKSELTKATLLATVYDPGGAVRAGYLDEIVPADAVLAKAKEEATKLTRLSKTAFEASKVRLRKKTIDHIYASLEADMASLLPS
ncbi:MAG: crotonase/enoyl-CoA hydratase family protein [Labilithrix sp.]|nr:crotonase/enoyl-CoA hydratase family protein [Labilithrix sp.]MCW5817069.1 crotonase/enoyl-CoA hydratase family protein [Labilithrix sp.]